MVVRVVIVGVAAASAVHVVIAGHLDRLKGVPLLPSPGPRVQLVIEVNRLGILIRPCVLGRLASVELRRLFLVERVDVRL